MIPSNTKPIKKSLLLLLTLLVAATTFAVDIPKGTFYYDNSITKFETVKFAYGDRDAKGTVLVTLTHQGNDIWSYTVPSTVKDVYRYIFLETALQDGVHNYTFSEFKDMVALERDEIRTATTDKTITSGFCRD